MTEQMEERPELDQKLSELEILRQSLEEARAKEKDTYDRFLRLAAEFDNYRKRMETRATEARRAGKEEVLVQAISLCDALIQAQNASENASDVGTLKEGVKLMLNQFEKFLSDQGLVAIKAKGEKMNPHLHEAVIQDAVPDIEEGVILEEIQRGYTMSDRVVRPSRVRVAAKPKEESPAISSEEEHHV